MRNLLTDNRHGLIVAAHLRAATGTAEREAAVEMMNGRGGRGVTLGADKAYDTRGLVKQLRAQGVTPQVAQNTNRLGRQRDRRANDASRRLWHQSTQAQTD